MKFHPLATKDIILATFPGRVVLTPKEVAQVWKGKTTRGVVEGIRAKLKRGRLIPGLKKRGGRWEVPVSDLIALVDSMVDYSRPIQHPSRYVPSTTGRKRTPIGPGRWGVPD